MFHILELGKGEYMMGVFGNLTNRVMESSRQVEPEVGMGATVTSFSDRAAGTVVEINVSCKAIIRVQEDAAKRTDNNGMSECQDYEYSADPDGRSWYFKKDKTGRWEQVWFNLKTNRWNKVGCGDGLFLGTRRKYHDFSF
jgi:hypothetical protein